LSQPDFDGTVLNPAGKEIFLPYWVFKRLKQLHLLERDRETGLRRIQARIFGLMPLWDGADFRPDKAFTAFNPDAIGGRSKDSGYASAFLRAIGNDCSGLVNPVVNREMQSDLDYTRLSDEHTKVVVDETREEVKRRRG
jgi:hypothetical protein